MIRIKSGKILIYRLYDVAHEINLPGVEERLHAEARRLKIERKPFSKALEFCQPACRVSTQEHRVGVRGAQASREHPRQGV